ncbi:MAG: hypothetical protein R3E12_18475 [Candidatus Eisenbacteria bacterium]
MFSYRLCLGLVLAAIVPTPTFGQAWIPQRGTGAMNVFYERYNGGDNLFNEPLPDGFVSLGYHGKGRRYFVGDVVSHTVRAELDYGATSRLAINVQAAHLTAKYVGHAPINTAIDNDEYHAQLQDLRVEARYGILQRRVRLTPFVAMSLPMSDYETNGHSAIGVGLVAAELGSYIGLEQPIPLLDFAQLGANAHFAEKERGKRLETMGLSLHGESFWVLPSPSRLCVTATGLGRAGVISNGAGVHDTTGPGIARRVSPTNASRESD